MSIRKAGSRTVEKGSPEAKRLEGKAPLAEKPKEPKSEEAKK